MVSKLSKEQDKKVGAITLPLWGIYIIFKWCRNWRFIAISNKPRIEHIQFTLFVHWNAICNYHCILR